MKLRRRLTCVTVLILLMNLGVVTDMAVWPQIPLRNKVEIYYDSAWHDISASVRGTGATDGEINIGARGMVDESSGVTTTTATFSLNNRNGDYSPRNVRSDLYGKIGPNTPVRIGTGALALDVIEFVGEIAEWPQRWDSTGNDVWVAMSASGITRRLVQGAKPLKSPLFRALSRTDLQGYWDFENLTADSYSEIPSALVGGSPLLYNSTSDAARTVWNGNNTLPGSAALPETTLPVVNGELIYGGGAPLLPPSSASNNTFSVVFWSRIPVGDDIPAGFTGLRVVVNVANSSTIAKWRFTSDTDPVVPGRHRLSAAAISPSGTSAWNTITGWTAYTGGWTMFRFTMEQNGANPRFRAYINEVLVSTATGGPANVIGTPLSIDEVSAISGVAGVPNAWGHVAVASGITTDPLAANGAFIYDASKGHVAETAVDRLIRICAEEDITLEINKGAGDDGTSAECGVQKQIAIVPLLQNTATVDDGVFYELRDDLGYGYRTRTSLYATANQLTANYTGTDLAEVPEVTDDDQRIRNDIIVTREDSNTSFQAVQTTGPMSINSPRDSPPGVGRYDVELRPALYDDAQSADYAGFRLLLGTRDESRWSTIVLAMHRAPFAGNPTKLAEAVGLEVGDILTVTNTPAWLSPDDVALQLRTVSVKMTNFLWTRTLSTLPGGPWQELGTVGDADYGRVETEGSALAIAVDSDDTALVVYTNEALQLPLTAPTWTEDINELNGYDAEGLQLRINPASRASGLGGEQVTIGRLFWATDTFTRSAAQLSGTVADSGQTWGTAVGVATNITVNGSAALSAHSAANTINGAQLDVLGGTDMCATADVSFSVTTATGAALRAMLYVRSDTAGTNAYWGRLELTGLVCTLRLGKTIASVSTDIGSLVTMAAANNSTIPWRLKVMVVNRGVYAKCWQPSVEDEPDWQASVPEGANEYLLAQRCALYSHRVTANSNANATITWDNLTVQTPKITPAYWDRYARTTVAGLGTADQGGTYSNWGAGGSILSSDWNTAPNRATTLIAVANAYRASRLGSINLQDVTASCVWTTVVPTGADLYAGNILLRGTTISSYVHCRVYLVPTTNTINLQILSAASVILGTYTLTGVVVAAATEFRTKAAAIGDQIMMKVWPVSSAEPSHWHLIVTDPATPIPGWVGWYNGRQSGNTNAAYTPTIADFRVDNPQQITAERATNNGESSWPIGADVRLWIPLRLAR